jgi:pyruvate kinase
MPKKRLPDTRSASRAKQPRSADLRTVQFRTTLAQLLKVRSGVHKLERAVAESLAAVHPSYRASARNLVHYVALRRYDVRKAQRVLASAGLASLGHCESAVLAVLNAVISLLRPLAGLPLRSNGEFKPPVAVEQAREILRRHTEALLGPKPHRRTARVMVTQPTEAATDYEFVKELVRRGMNCARINCAHDGPDVWVQIARNVRRASRDLDLPCRVIMDLGGPKIRTGRIEPGPPAVKWRPVRDRLGRVVTPAAICLAARGREVAPRQGVAATLTLPVGFIEGLKEGDWIRFCDTRGASRSIRVVSRADTYALAEARETAYVTNGTVLVAGPRARKKRRARSHEATVRGIPREDPPLLLLRGDALIVTRSGAAGREARVGPDGRIEEPARIGCTLPTAIANARRGEAIWFDDGKIGGVIESVHDDHLRVRITHARPGGERLRAEKGINLPDTRMDLSALTRRDLADLSVVARHADIVGLSFVRSVDDVRRLRSRMARTGGRCRAVLLKVEARRAFELLPELLLEAMLSPAIGIMIARGDLAVECGYERLAEVQEEILWICEAAHVPVVWATQVLESLARTGQPSRAEITDAAMSERAECVMLNKGPHVLEAVDLLERILRRMEAHQHKKRAMLRRLRWWSRVERRIEGWRARE